MRNTSSLTPADLRRGALIVASSVWLVFLMLFALANGGVLVDEIVHYGRENRAPGLTVALLALAEVAVLGAGAARHRALRQRDRLEAAATVRSGLWMTIAALALFIFAMFVAFAAGPH